MIRRKNQLDVMPPGAQTLRFLIQGLHQHGYIHLGFLQAVLRAFQPRQREQVFHQRAHALGLLLHQIAVAAEIDRVDVFHVGKGFEETADHGQRRAQFVRDIGDKIAAHRLQQFNLRNITRNQHFALVAERHQLHRQRDIAAGG